MAYATYAWHTSDAVSLAVGLSDGDDWTHATATPDRISVTWTSPLDLEAINDLWSALPSEPRPPLRLFDDWFETQIEQYQGGGLAFDEPPGDDDNQRSADDAFVLELAVTPGQPLEVSFASPHINMDVLANLSARSNAPSVVDWFDSVRAELDDRRLGLARYRPAVVPTPQTASCAIDVGITTLKVYTWVQQNIPCQLGAATNADLCVVVDNARVKTEWVEVRLTGLTSATVTCQHAAPGQVRSAAASTAFVAPATVGPYNARFDGYKAQAYPVPPGAAPLAMMHSAVGQVFVQ